MLQQIYEGEQAYYKTFGRYCCAPGVITSLSNPGLFADSLGVTLPKNARYEYWVAIKADDGKFVAWAETYALNGLDSDPANDIWKIGQNGALTSFLDDVTATQSKSYNFYEWFQ